MIDTGCTGTNWWNQSLFNMIFFESKEHQRYCPWKCKNIPPGLIIVMPKICFLTIYITLSKWIKHQGPLQATSRHSMTKFVVFEWQDIVICQCYQKVQKTSIYLRIVLTESTFWNFALHNRRNISLMLRGQKSSFPESFLDLVMF